MNQIPRLGAIVLACGLSTTAWGDSNGRIQSLYSARDFELTADPESAPWRDISAVIAANGPLGRPTPGHTTRIYSRWSGDHLYVLFVCPYERLYLKPAPPSPAETNQLWNWDVAEVFVGGDFAHPRHYREYQVSPRGEFVDLDIDRDHPLPEGGWRWNSGFTVKARIDEKKRVWFGEMKIPMASINGPDGQPFRPRAGAELRVNFYRLQGPPNAQGKRAGIAWQPTGQPSYHVPEAFGHMVLTK